jgi:hypothetical protein
MGDKNFPALAVQIDFLVRRKFGKAVQDTLKRGGRVPHYFPEANKRIQEAEEYQAELCAMLPEKVQALYEQEHEKERHEHEKVRTERRVEADREEAQRFFNQPGAEADFAHWSKHWTLDEAIALSFGKAPEVVSWEKVKGYVGQSRFATQYARVRDLALRATRWHQLYDPVLPGFFLAWAKRNDIDYPAELEAQVVARGHQIADWKSLYDGLQAQYNELKAQHEAAAARVQALLDENKNLIDGFAAERDSLRSRVAQLDHALGQGQVNDQPLPTRVRGTLLKLIIGMAVKGYGYDRKAKRSDEISEIVDDLNSVGVSLEADTVRKWLREAADLLPREGLDNKDR